MSNKAHIEVGKGEDNRYYEVSVNGERFVIGEFKDSEFVFAESYDKLSDDHKETLKRWISQVKKK